MKQLRHTLSLVLALCMVLGMVTPLLAESYEISVETDYEIPVETDNDDGFYFDVVDEDDGYELSVLPGEDELPDEDYTTEGTADKNGASSVEYSMSIVHVDCGRKYFTVDEINTIIDNAAAAGFNYVELAVGNDGLRFLLDDMSITVGGTTYVSDNVAAAVHAGNETYADFDVDELTQSEMDKIIAHANEKGVGIIPLINTPGHMDAILAAAETLTGVQCDFDGSTTTIDVTNSTAVEFTKALLQKYITYFAGKGCKYFNIGADEYANDVYPKGGMGFGQIKENKYTNYVEYVNAVNAMVKAKGMTSMMFNDGVMYGGKTGIDTGILVCYWSSGWNEYEVASADTLVANEYKLINTHGDYYWTLGKSQCTVEKAGEFVKETFIGSTSEISPVGAMFCIWCDFPNADTAANVITATADVIDAFGATLPTAVSKGGANDETTPTDYIEVNIQVGETATKTIDGYNYENDVDETQFDTAIATKDVKGVNESSTEVTTYTLGSKLDRVNNVKGVVSDGNGHYIKLNGTTVEATGEISEATEFTGITSGSSTSSRYKLKSGDYYLTYNNNGNLTVSTSESSNSWVYGSSSGFRAGSNTGYYIAYKSGEWSVLYYNYYYTSAALGYLYSRTANTSTVPVPASTTVTFTGVSAGTTYLKVGTQWYKVNVTAVSDPLTIEYWITNDHVQKSSTDTSNSVTLQNTYSGITSEDGVDVTAIVPSQGLRTRTLDYWKCLLLDKTKENNSTSGTEEQTIDAGDDETTNGVEFTKVRFNGAWQVYTVNNEWVTVDLTKNQLVAYYLEVIDIKNSNLTSELYVNAADWGTKGDGSSTWGYTPESDRCSVSVQLVYEDGQTNPSDTTAANLRSKTIVYGYWSAGRGIGTMFFNGQEDYQIYKVTAETGTMVSSTSSSSITATNGVYVTSFTWDKNEETVWEGDLAKTVSVHNNAKNPTYTAPYDNLAWNTSSGNENNAILIRVYVKAVAKESSLNVHYIEKKSNIEFYTYSINVADGTFFNNGFARGTEKNSLINNTVSNYYGKTQTVSADISTLPQITSQYKYSVFTLDEVTLGGDVGTATDGHKYKDVYLYYTFDNIKEFVVDFGATLQLTAADLGITSSGWTNADFIGECTDTTVGDVVWHTKQYQYGTATIAVDNPLTYTVTTPMQGIETISINLWGTKGAETNADTPENDKPATYYIAIIPATNVLYEETVMTEQNLLGVTDPANKWEKLGTSTVGNQQLEVLNNDGTTTNVYGYDSVYAEDTGFSGDTYYKATLTATDKQAATDTALSFTFTGTGFDLISECGPQTGSILVRLSVLNDDGTKTLKKGYYVDTYFVGDGTIINSADADANGVLDYQVPVVRDLNLAYGTYVADVYGYVYPKSTASANSVGKMVSAESIVSEALDSLGFNDSVEMYEISYMDENSVLNGGTGISEMSVVKDKDVYTSDVISDNMMSAYMYENLADEKNETASTTGYVYVDGVRVYGTMSTTLDNADGYKAEERGTKYYNVYDFVNTSVNDLDSLKNNFAVYVEHDGNTGVYTIKDYKNMGPKNEVYLTDGSAIAFIITGYEPGNQSKYTVQVSMKAVQGESNVLVSKDDKTDNEIPVYANTEMYYTVPVRTATLTDSGDTIDYVLIEVPEDANDNVVISISGIKVSNNIKPVSDVETLGEILVNEASGTFSPEVFSVKKIESVKSKRKFTVSVSTSTDANKILVTVDGTEYTLTPTNTSAVEIGATKIYSYSTSIRAPEKTADKTTFTVSVVACSTADNNVQSDPVTMTVTIK